MTDATQKKDRKYNLIGTATNIVVVQPPSGGRFARFKINRGAKGMQDAKMRDTVLARFEAAGFGEGSSVDFYGFYQKHTWTGQDGQLRTSQIFDVLAVSAPKTREEIAALKAAKAARTGGEAPAAQAPAATDATAGEEIPF
jgi:hypothetical protein